MMWSVLCVLLDSTMHVLPQLQLHIAITEPLNQSLL